MKLYEFKDFPNPRRVRMFIAEKGIEVERVQVDVPNGEHREPDFLALNPFAGVPVLQLDGALCIAETIAISRYLEERFPEPALFGVGATKVAEVEMWQRRIEQGLFDPALSYFHHATPGLGHLETYQNPEWGVHNRQRVGRALAMLNNRLEESRHVAGKRFSIADITALVAVDFAAAVAIPIPETYIHLARWYAEVSKRPSAAA